MTLKDSIQVSELAELTELEKVLHFAFYHLKEGQSEDFSAAQGAKWVAENRMGNPNVKY
jgi:hypothetical protein